MTYLRANIFTPVITVLLILLSIMALSTGDMELSLADIVNGLLHRNELAATIIWQIRLPRLLVAMLVGAALSASGLIMQAYFRNPLASPGLLGVSSGAAAGAALILGLGLATNLYAAPLAAISGASLATIAVISLARQGASTERLLLAGVALNAFLGAVTSYMLSNFSLTYEKNAQIIFWLLGGLEDRTWEHVFMASPIFLFAFMLIPLGRQMDLLSLGAAEAQSLGVNVTRLRRQLLALSTVLAALATAVAGTVGFVGLLVPHILRLMLGPEHRRILPLSLVTGACFVLSCDLIGRSLGNIRLGIITAVLGGPFFLYLLRRRTR